MNRRAWVALVACCSLAGPVRAEFVFGCAQHDEKMPRVVLRLLDQQMRVRSTFDSWVDGQWVLPGDYQLPLADGSMHVEYGGEDVRALYGNLPQTISVQFADLLPPDKMGKHPCGRAENIPVGEARPVVNWLGTATFFTIAGIVSDGIVTTPCQWFCQIDIDWVATPLSASSFGRVKALY